jgi:hypothetical protein
MRAVASLLLFLAMGGAARAATCPDAEYANEWEMRLPQDRLLIVTHVSRYWDEHESSKKGANAAVRLAKGEGVPVVYLQGPRSRAGYFYDDCDPTYTVGSMAGEISFEFDAREVLSVGGHFEECEQQTVQDVIKVLTRKHPREAVKVTELAEGIYTHGAYNQESDPYIHALRVFKAITGYVRYTLGTIMDNVDDDSFRAEYLARQVSALELPPSHTAQVAVNGKVLRVVSDRGAGAPTLTFDVVTRKVSGMRSLP